VSHAIASINEEDVDCLLRITQVAAYRTEWRFIRVT
jgi:hypothetical protein